MEEQIEKYVRNGMNSVEKSAFEAEISKHTELATMVKLFQSEYKAMDILAEADLIQKMNGWEAEIALMNAPAQAMTVKKSSYKRLYWALSAAAVLVLGLVGWWFLRDPEEVSLAPVIVQESPRKPTAPPKSPTTTPKPKNAEPIPTPREDAPRTAEQVSKPPVRSPDPPAPNKPPVPAAPAPDYQALAATYYNSTEFIKTSVKPSAQDPTSVIYGQALDRYSSGKYQDATKLLKTLLKASPNETQSRELLAHTLYKSGKYEEAIPYLRRLSGTGSNASAQRADWALTLAYLRQMPSKKASALQYLNKINANPKHLYYNQAKRLKSDLGW
jgi:TolA-binding protein